MSTISSSLLAASTAIVLLLGLAHLLYTLGYVFLAARYFFRIPFLGVVLATALYAVAVLLRQV